MGYKAATRIAISHSILFTLLVYTFVLLGCTLEKEDDPNFRITRRALFVVAGFFIYPLLSSFVLLAGILMQKIVMVRLWLISSTIVSVILMFLLLSGAIYISVSLDVYWGIILCAMPFVLTLWLAEGIIVVFTYYKKTEAPITKQELA